MTDDNSDGDDDDDGDGDDGGDDNGNAGDAMWREGCADETSK